MSLDNSDNLNKMDNKKVIISGVIIFAWIVLVLFSKYPDYRYRNVDIVNEINLNY